MDIAFCPGFHLPDDRGRTVQLYRELGAKSVQLYIDWKQVEPKPGQYDWSAYDRDAEALASAGLKLGPFIICGSWYVTPQFVRDEPGMVMYRCVEHDRDTAMPSLWCPNIRPHIERFLHALAEHFGSSGALGYVLLGPTGDYGEALYPIVGNGPGAYHGHPGHWCADPLALADLRRWAAMQYEDIRQLNASWGTNWGAFDELKPFTRRHAPSERAYVEMIRWYRQSMTRFCDFWLEAARSAFGGLPPIQVGGLPIYLCTGGLMLPEHGSDFSAQVRAAADHGAGVRVTNESSDYASNFMLTRLVNSAARGYGGFSSHEPAATVTPKGVVARVFSGIAGGCAQLFSYPGAYIEGDKISSGGEVFKRLRPLLRKRSPVVPVALFYPDTDRVLSGEVPFDRFHLALRKLLDFDLIDENMIWDDLLARYRYLVVAGAERMAQETTGKISSWVKSGGVLLNVSCLISDFQENAALWQELIGFTADTDRHYGVMEQAIPRPELLPRYQKLMPLWATASYGPLAADCLPLVGMRGSWYEPVAEYSRLAWQRKVGKGAVISYFGLIDPRSGHGGWATSDAAALTFLADVFEHAGELGLPPIQVGGLPGEAPTTLRPEMDGLYLSQFEDGLLAMNFADTPLAITFEGKTITIGPDDIVELS
jgi:hypothetical protein